MHRPSPATRPVGATMEAAPGLSMASDMRDLLASERYSDVVLIAKGGTARFRGHKAVLTTRCSRLRLLIEAADEAVGDGGAEARPSHTDVDPPSY